MFATWRLRAHDLPRCRAQWSKDCHHPMRTCCFGLPIGFDCNLTMLLWSWRSSLNLTALPSIIQQSLLVGTHISCNSAAHSSYLPIQGYTQKVSGARILVHLHGSIDLLSLSGSDYGHDPRGCVMEISRLDIGLDMSSVHLQFRVRSWKLRLPMQHICSVIR